MKINEASTKLTVILKRRFTKEQDLNLGPVVARFHLWIDGPKLWLGLNLCIASFCSPEAQTSFDLPH
jgi:hypothetical protein